MLRASSSGLSLLLQVIRLHRRGRPFLLESSPSQRRRAVWAAHASLILGSNSQAVRNRPCSGNGVFDFQDPRGTPKELQHDGCQKRDEDTLYAILQSQFSPGTPFLTLPVTREKVDVASQAQIPSYPVGKSQSPTVKPIRWGKKTGAYAREALSTASNAADSTDCGPDSEINPGELLRVLESTGCASTAWNAYTALLNRIPQDCDVSRAPFIPFAHLHRLCRVLASKRPKTHVQFLRILSVLNWIRSSGGRIHLHEWNVLIDHAARGWRKARPEDLETALSLYNDMVNGHPPGSTLEGKIQTSNRDENYVTLPDIYTYNSLINAAVNSHQPHTVRHVVNLMNASGVLPNRITFLTLLKYYSTSRQMSAVRSTVLELKERGFDLEVDGINACMWAYGQNERPDVVMNIYRLLQHNVPPGQELRVEDSVLALRQQLVEEEYIHVPGNVRPNHVTFAVMIQVMAYHGDLSATLSVFADMLDLLSPRLRGSEGVTDAHLATLNTVFRAIFLGFSRHGIPPLQDGNSLPSHLRPGNVLGRAHWTLQNLQIIFNTFLNIPGDVKASRSTVHWIMSAFDLTSGQNEDVLREVWARLDGRFGAKFEAHWVAPTNRLAAWRERLFPELNKRPGYRDSSMVDDDLSEHSKF